MAQPTNAHPNPPPHVPSSGASQGVSKDGDPTQKNEGEGSRSAARHYDAKTEEYVRSGRVEAAAEKAKRALSGPEAEALKEAEAEGRAGNPPESKGDR